MWVERAARGVIDREQQVYGHRRNGVACTFVAADEPSGLLVHAGIHGTEPDAVVVLSSALRLVPAGHLATRHRAASGTGRAAPDASAPPSSCRTQRSRR